jgi:hypothetical protein
MNAQLTHIANGAILAEFLRQDAKISLAGAADILQGAEGAIKSYVESTFDKNRPIASIVSFITAGLLWNLKSKKLAILYMVAGALGFDWKSFWDALGKSVVAIVQEIHGGKKAVSDEEATGKLNQTVSSILPQHFTGNVDMPKVLDLAKKVFANDLDNALKLTKQGNQIIKTAGIATKLISFFTSAISWAVKAALVAAGIWVGGSAVKHMIGDKSKEEAQSQETQPEVPSNVLKINPNASPDLFAPHKNDISSFWIEHGDIDEVEDMLANWVIDAYPQFSKYTPTLKSSSAFQSMVNAFKQRNKLASGIGLISIPRPYQRKIDIISTIVNGFLHEAKMPEVEDRYRSIPA